MVNSASAIARPASSAVTALASAVAAFVRTFVRSAAAATSLAPSSSAVRSRPVSASSETSSWASRSRDSAAQASTPSTSAAYLRVSERNSAWRASLVSNVLASVGRSDRNPPISRATSPTTVKVSPSWVPRFCSTASSVPCRAVIARPIAVVAATGFAVQRIVGVPGQCQPGRRRRLPQRVEFGEPADVGDQRLVLARLRVDGVDLTERELQPVGLLREFPRPLGAVDRDRGGRGATRHAPSDSARAGP